MRYRSKDHRRTDIKRELEGAQANNLTLVTNISPQGEMFNSQNVQLDHVSRVWAGGYILWWVEATQTSHSLPLEKFTWTTLANYIFERFSGKGSASVSPYGVVSLGASSGSWRNWPGRASACWPGPRLMRTPRGSAHLVRCSSCWSLHWEPDCSTSPGLSRRREEWPPPSVWSWWGHHLYLGHAGN